MAQLFVSHSSADNELAAKVEDALAGLGYQSVFLDFDPTRGLRPGQAWRDQLFENLDGCDAVVFLTTPQSNASQWCHSELALTRWLRKPILALLFDGVPPHPLTADLQGLHLSSDHVDSERVRSALVALGLDQEAAWDSARSPYPGLRAFDESYSAVFFGRDRQIDQLRQLVDPPSRSHEGAIIPVLGPSGSGKSSLVRAGLVPALRVSPDWVVSEPWTPSDAPLAEMGLALAHAAKRQDADLDATRCGELLREPGGMAEYVRHLREAGTAGADTKVLVIVDQSEELVTITSEPERQAFLEALTASCAAPSPLRLVMTARTDMWDRVASELGRFSMSVAPTVLHVPPLTRSDLAQVIREPARRSHLELEEGLVDRLVDDTGSGDALPLLAFTLARMAADAKDRRLTVAGYDAVGGVQGAIASRAAEVAHGGRTEQQVAEALLHLVSLSEAVPHKRLARADEIPPEHRQILDELVDARLVVVSEVNDQQVYAPAHEALLSAWPPLVQLIESRRDDLLLRARLERRAADWSDAGVASSGLLSGLELDQAEDWVERSGDLAAPGVRQYVDASAQRQRRTRMVRAAVGAVVFGLAVALVAVLFFTARHERRQADARRVGELVAIAERERVDDPAAAAIALLEALRVNPHDGATTKLAGQLVAAPARDVLHGDSTTSYLGETTGGDVVLGFNSSGPVVWDTVSGHVVKGLPATGLAAVRPDGRVVSVVAGDGGATTYDLATDPAKKLAEVGASVTLLAYSPDGSVLAVASNAAVTLYDVRDPASPRRLATWLAPGNGLTAIALLDDSHVLASGDHAELMEWSPQDPTTTRTILSIPGGVDRIDADAKHDRALLSVFLKPAQLVDLGSGTTVRTFTAVDPALPANSPARLYAVTMTTAMQPTTGQVAAIDIGARGYVFSADNGHLTSRLVGGQSALIFRTGFTRSGDVATSGFDGAIRLWDPASATERHTGSATDRLCAVFGSRIDADSWRLAMGGRAFASPCPAAKRAVAAPLAVSGDVPLPSDTTVATPGTTVFDEEFDGRKTALPSGSNTYGNGSYTESLSGGQYQFSVTAIGADVGLWSHTDTGSLGDVWSLATTIVGDPAGHCGLVAGDGTTYVTATLDPTTSSGQLSWYAKTAGSSTYPPIGRTAFAVPAGSTGPLSLVMDHGELTVLVGGTRLATAHDAQLPPPTQAGVTAIGDTTSCSFDDLVVRKGP